MLRTKIILALSGVAALLVTRPVAAEKAKIACHYTINLVKGFDPATMKDILGTQLAEETTSPKGGASCEDATTEKLHQLCTTRPKGVSLQAQLNFIIDGKPAPRMRKSIGYECTDLDHFPDAKVPKGCRHQIWKLKELCIRNYLANHPSGR